MTYLLDTNVLSALAPNKTKAVTDLVDWLDAASARLYLSTVTAAEIHDGIAKAKRQGATRKAETLSAWWQAVEHLYGDRILPFDLASARLAGILADKARGAGHDPGFADIIIAATAEAHGLTILTRNIRHFVPIGVAALDPFQALPPFPTA